jgi:hypothetical protein
MKMRERGERTCFADVVEAIRMQDRTADLGTAAENA